MSPSYPEADLAKKGRFLSLPPSLLTYSTPAPGTIALPILPILNTAPQSETKHSALPKSCSNCKEISYRKASLAYPFTAMACEVDGTRNTVPHSQSSTPSLISFMLQLIFQGAELVPQTPLKYCLGATYARLVVQEGGRKGINFLFFRN